jgi:predicted O-methyltransferase YrrM
MDNAPSVNAFVPSLRAVLDHVHAAAKNDVWVFLRGAPAGLLGLLRGKGVEESMRDHLKNAYIPIDRRQGEVLYLLTRAIRAKKVVEFGSSFGISTLYLAAAVRDLGEGSVVGSELEPNKRIAALDHLERAGLTAWAEIRPGDALRSLACVEGPIDLLFLDGWKDLYLPMLKLLEPKLRPGALVLADDTKPFRRRLAAYLHYVRSPENGYLSVDLPLGDGLEVTMRTAVPGSVG